MGCLLMIPATLLGQKASPPDKMRKSLDFMFEHLDRNAVPKGLLRDYAIEYEDLDLFSGEAPLEENNIGTIVRYSNLLKTISSSAVKEDPLKGFERSVGKLKKRPGELTLSVMLYEYARMKANVLTDGIIRYENGQIYHTDKPESPYQLEYAFAGCCLEASVQRPEVMFTLPSAFWLTNCGIKKMEIDFGAGFRRIEPDQSVNATLAKGMNKLVIRATLQNGRILSAHTVVQVEGVEQRLQPRALNGDGLTAHDSAVIQGRDYKGIHTSAEVTVSYAPGNRSLKKPLIVVEGFDPRVDGKNPKGGWSFDRIRFDPGICDFNRNQGYDIVYVDWVKAEDYIQSNAYTLESVIAWVNGRKAESGSQEANVVIGHSMGGLVARYALKTMENQGIRHQVSAYVSYDAPHLGAHVPLGVLYAFHGILSFFDEHRLIGTLINTFTSANTYIRLGKSIAYSPAARQMLVHYVDLAGNYNNQEHIHWQNELKTLGFPQGDLGSSFKMLAVSNGSYGPVDVPSYYLTANFSVGTGTKSALLSREQGPEAEAGLNEVVAGLLAALPNSTGINGSFNVYPARAEGDLITNIRVQYKKAFLWTAPKAESLFAYDRNYQGTYFYDTYPSSYYALRLDQLGLPAAKNENRSFPLAFGIEHDVKASSGIPFVPNSSALAYGDGVEVVPADFLSPPQGTSSPFEENYYTHSSVRSHLSFTSDALAWVSQRLSVSIVGPGVGTDGARYSLSNAAGQVSWSSSDPSVADISSEGVLAVKGTGITTITARHGGQTCRQTIMVGMPRYILAASHGAEGCEISAQCIDEQFKAPLLNLNGGLKYHWGVRYAGQAVRWSESDVPVLKMELPAQDEKAVVFLQVVDPLGNRSPLQHIEINSPDVYVAKNQNLYIDGQGVLYQENKKKCLYDSARLSIFYGANVPDRYRASEWTVVRAMVLRPSGAASVIDARHEGPLLKDILPPAELDGMKNGSADNQVYRYTLVLLNDKGKAIQLMPVTFTYKTEI